MAKIYTTPDFDVTAYEIKELITKDDFGFVDGDPNEGDFGGVNPSWGWDTDSN